MISDIFEAVALRIGEQLVRDGLITSADVEEGLTVAREQGIRLVSALVLLDRLSADNASRALAAQHGVPAALCKHLEGRDVSLTELLPAALAHSLLALPLAVSRGRDALVVCVRDPGPDIAAALAEALGRPIVLAVAVESMLLAVLEAAYPLDVDVDADDDPDEFEVDLETDSQMPVMSDGFDPDDLQLVDLDDRAVSRDLSQITGSQRVTSTGMAVTDGLGAAVSGARRARRTSSLLSAIPAKSERPTTVSVPAVAPPPALPVATPPTRAAVVPPPAFALDPALVKVSAAENGDQVIEAVIGLLRYRFEVGIVFVVRDGMALGQVGFGAGLVDEAIDALLVPLNQPSVLRTAYDKVASYVGAPTQLSVVQDRLFRMFGGRPSRVAVVPVTVKGRVVNLIYAHGPRGIELGDGAGELATLAMAAEDAFVRIIRAAKS